jgi:hypothetical protein
VDALVAAHIDAKLRLQRLAAAVAAAVWDRLPHYDRANVDQFMSQALPLVHGANLQSVALTDAYIARALERQPTGVDAQAIVAGIRNGTTPEETYHRAFVSVWSALSRGLSFEEAVKIGRDRVTTAAATDVQLAFRDTLPPIGARAPVMGWQRVADPGACPFCTRVDGAIMRVAVPMPLHPHCGCTIEPIELAPGRPALEPTPTPDDVAIHEHGELGPLLGAPGDAFAGPATVAH